MRGKDYFGRIVKNVRSFRDLQEREGKDRPRVSAWLTGLKETSMRYPYSRLILTLTLLLSIPSVFHTRQQKAIRPDAKPSYIAS